MVGLLAGLLVSCGAPAPVPGRSVVITAPAANAQLVTNTPVKVEGTASLGASVTVAIGTASPFAATLLGPAGGRQPWTAELVMPSVGNYSITATATGPDFDPAEATLPVKVVALQPYGIWQGLFTLDGTASGGTIIEDTMLVSYEGKWFRLSFPVGYVYGVTEGWDMIDKGGFRMVGTYHEAGEMFRDSYISDEPWVSFYGVTELGEVFDGFVFLDD